MKNQYKLSRRHFLRTTAVAAGASAIYFPYVGNVLGANDRINVGCIGVGGKGSSDTDDAARCGGNIVALCDVDENVLKQKAQKYPQAKLYRDFRKMIDEMEKSIDAVTVSTPDHTHAAAAALAMREGKHIYCQKPLTQTVSEARLLRKLAKDKKLATQMGNQGSAQSGLRRAVEVIQSGIIGGVTELHVWSNRPIWPSGFARPEGQDPVPAHLDWDLWLGPAKMRPYKEKIYHPFAWRGWYDFGTGALGDMACHTVNMPFRALKMGYPSLVVCEETSEMFPETFPKTSRIRFEFPAREGMPPLKFWWYDGSPNDKEVKALRPGGETVKDIIALRNQLPPSGCLLIGEKGKIFSPDDYGAEFFIMLNGMKGFVPGAVRNQPEHESIRSIPQSIPRSPGHTEEWFAAMKGGPAAYSNFDIAAYLTEIILLGVVAMRVGVGREMQWNGPKMRSPNIKEARRFVEKDARKGWRV
ncbi:MAG TPA: Gfo/Idh/MocA family oxidoreductase [Methylomirabilota bacterium]|nr:Gfo/Idh/MocA family oxidoreductase [Methylomirabilota bacterium]